MTYIINSRFRVHHARLQSLGASGGSVAVNAGGPVSCLFLGERQLDLMNNVCIYNHPEVGRIWKV